MSAGESMSPEEAFDAAVAAKLREVAPPPGLREAILAGSRRESARRRAPGFLPWLAIAAAVALLAGGGVRWLHTAHAPAESVTAAGPAAPAGDVLVAGALYDVLHEKHKGLDVDQGALASVLGDPAMVLAGPLPVDVPQLRRIGCRSIRIGGREVFELCFKRQGTILHLYATLRGAEDRARSLTLASEGELAAATWSDTRFDYVLVGAADAKEMLQLMRAS